MLILPVLIRQDPNANERKRRSQCLLTHFSYHKAWKCTPGSLTSLETSQGSTATTWRLQEHSTIIVNMSLVSYDTTQ